MSQQNSFPYTNGASDLERRHPHIVERLRFLWGYPEGGRYLARLIVDTRGGRTGFSREVMSELMTLANMAANPGTHEGRTAPFQVAARRGNGAMRAWTDGTLSLHPISFSPS